MAESEIKNPAKCIPFNDLVATAGRSLLIVLLALFSSITFNYFRPSPLNWDWKPSLPQALQINDLNMFEELMKQPNTIVVDARDEFFFEMGHIPGALSLPLASSDLKRLTAWAETLAPQAIIIIYCSDEFCNMAAELAEKMTAIGLEPQIFTPGFEAWEAEGLPVESLEDY